MKLKFSVESDKPQEAVVLERDGVETVEDMLFFFQRCFEAAGYPYIDGVGAISKKQRFEPTQWWSTL